MCGIAGLLDTSQKFSAESMESTIYRMIRSLIHRGPDSEGIWIDSAAGIALGHRRLAIIDLSPTGWQPMQSADGRYVIVFNGEIYNHKDLRESLLKEGCRFRGSSDTEVILEGFGIWGIKATLERMIGMFALALWDRANRVLSLARDRMGEKPLYYGWCGSVFAFGSELKALCTLPTWQPEIDYDALAVYFRSNYIPSPLSIYKGIYKLYPGTLLNLRVDKDPIGFMPEATAYWSLRDIAETGARNLFKGSDQEAIGELDRLLRLAVSGQMIADVPLGAFLSGGIDSSTVVALMQDQSRYPVKTFTIGFEEAAYDEAKHARAVARHLGTDHTELYVSHKDALNVLPQWPRIYDEPFADSSGIPTFLVAQLARQKVGVSLSGDGGDEMFCGYNRHVKLDAIWKRAQWIPYQLRRSFESLFHLIPVDPLEAVLRRCKYGLLSDQLQKLLAILRLKGPEQMYIRLSTFWEDPSLVIGACEIPTLLSDTRQWPELPTPLEQMLYVESMTSLPGDMLAKVDRAAMALSLETRIPFLDHRIVEFAWRLPMSMKLRCGIGKWVLRQVLYKYVPQSLIERPKSGFGVPIDQWLRGPLRSWAEDLLSESRLTRQGILNPKPIRQKWHEHISGYRKWQYHLWGVLMFEAWLDHR